MYRELFVCTLNDMCSVGLQGLSFSLAFNLGCARSMLGRSSPRTGELPP